MATASEAGQLTEHRVERRLQATDPVQPPAPMQRSPKRSSRTVGATARTKRISEPTIRAWPAGDPRVAGGLATRHHDLAVVE